jgi:hypothetical protein
MHTSSLYTHIISPALNKPPSAGVGAAGVGAADVDGAEVDPNKPPVGAVAGAPNKPPGAAVGASAGAVLKENAMF